MDHALSQHLVAISCYLLTFWFLRYLVMAPNISSCFLISPLDLESIWHALIVFFSLSWWMLCTETLKWGTLNNQSLSISFFHQWVFGTSMSSLFLELLLIPDFQYQTVIHSPNLSKIHHLHVHLLFSHTLDLNVAQYDCFGSHYDFPDQQDKYTC